MAKQHKAAANTSPGPVAFNSSFLPWLHLCFGSKHLIFLFIYKKTLNDCVDWIVLVCTVRIQKCCAPQILPWIYVFMCNPSKSRSGWDSDKKTTNPTQERLDVKTKTFILCRNKRSTEHNCSVNLMAVNLIYVVGRCAEALFQAQIHLLPDSSPTSLAKPGIMALQLERNQSCSEILCHPIFSFLLMGRWMCKQHMAFWRWIFLNYSYSHQWPTLLLCISFKEVNAMGLNCSEICSVFCNQVTQFGLLGYSSDEDSS